MGEGVSARRCRVRPLVWASAALLATGGAEARAVPHDEANCARPALWVVSDSDTTVYLFGTIHTHDGRAHWFDHAVRRAFDASDTLVLETVIPPSGAPRVEPPSGGLVTARDTVRTARALGFSVALGADRVLERAAHAQSKPVIGLESFADQIAMYRALPAPARSAAPAAAAAAPAPDLGPMLRTLVESWNRGDGTPIAAVVGSVRAGSPEAYRLLFRDRNAAWADWIARRLDAPGTIFVAVGTGHLVGEHSVQAELGRRGIPSARVN